MPKLITEQDIQVAKQTGKSSVVVDEKTIITPSARDVAKSAGIQLIFGQDNGRKQQADKLTNTPPLISNATIFIGADHGGFDMKNMLIRFLNSHGYRVDDVGCHSPDPVDYPDIAHAVAEAVANKNNTFGIIVDGAGIGSAIVANKVPGIRAACCNDLFTAVNSREHNGANILTLGGRVIGDELAKKIVHTWLQTNFGGGRHKMRVDKIDLVEKKYRRSG